MALTRITTLLDMMQTTFNPSAGSASGSSITIPFPARARVTEVGFSPKTAIASDTTMRVQIGQFVSSTASVLTEIISSTLGTFDSNMLIAGAIASASPPSPSFGNVGDYLLVTTSGGNGVTIGATVYANFRRS